MSNTNVYKWTDEKIVALAEALEKYPALWDRGCDDYKKNVVKYDARKHLAAELEVEVPILNAKLNSIFSQYAREMKKEKVAASGSSAGDPRFVSKWFLLPHLKYMYKTTELRETMNSNTSRDLMFIVAQEGTGDDDEEIVQVYDEEIDGNTYIQDDEEHEALLNIQHEMQSPSSTSSVLLRKPPTSRKRPQSDNAISKAVLSIASSLNDDGDEWDALGVLVAKKIRSLKNPQLQMKAESAIHNILIEAKASAEGFSLVSAPNPNIIFTQMKPTTKQLRQIFYTS